jgi:adenylate kinase family enzyme
MPSHAMEHQYVADVDSCRLHVTGASGSGTTTLGRALANLWEIPHADSDDYFWQPTTPPYLDKRPVVERLALMEALFLPRDKWVLSGSLMGWGDELAARFDAVVFLTLDPATRLSRLRARETTRLGSAIAPGGHMAASHDAFMEWAQSYDKPEFEGRNLVRHEEWLAQLRCPVLRLTSDKSVQGLVAAVQAWIPSGG